MKKVLLLAATAGIVLSSCVKNEPATKFEASDSKITFEAPVVGTTTRAVAGEIDGNYPKEESFKVWGWYHTNNYTSFGDEANGWSNYMTDADGNPLTVTNEGDTWAPAQDYYWPKTGMLTFAAYSPADAQGTFAQGANGLTIIGFTVPNVGEQYDLMYSDRSYNRTTTENTYEGDGWNPPYTGVDIVFRHALSSIVFKTGTNGELSETADMAFTIKKITIKNVANSGDFNENLEDGTTTRTAAWGNQGAATTEYEAFSGNFPVPTDGTTAEPTGAADLILLPQSFESNANAVVEIQYSYKTAASDEILATETFKLQDATDALTWEPNKRYTYNILFGLDKITFAPVVEPWQDVTITPDLGL